jgi:ankyrin repeat protein
MWAGADPRSRGPKVEDVDDSEWSTTALHEASESGNVDVLRRLRPDRSDDLAGMLERAAFRANSDMVAYLLDRGANLNDKPDGGSSALDACLRILGWEELERVEHGDFAIYEESQQKPSRGKAPSGFCFGMAPSGLRMSPRWTSRASDSLQVGAGHPR